MKVFAQNIDNAPYWVISPTTTGEYEELTFLRRLNRQRIKDKKSPLSIQLYKITAKLTYNDQSMGFPVTVARIPISPGIDPKVDQNEAYAYFQAVSDQYLSVDKAIELGAASKLPSSALISIDQLTEQ